MVDDAIDDIEEKNKQMKKNLEFEKIDDDEDIHMKKSYEYEDVEIFKLEKASIY